MIPQVAINDCSDFLRKQNTYAWGAFFVQSIFGDRNNGFDKKTLRSIAPLKILTL